MDTHVHILSTLCRVCGKNATSYGCDKSLYALQFQELFGINLDLDSPDTHPNLICKAHKLLFSRASQATKPYRTTVKPVQFYPHSAFAECPVCIVKQGRPEKTSPPPGIQSLLEDIMSLDEQTRHHFYDGLVKSISHEDRTQIARCLGACMKKGIENDARSFANQYKDRAFLANVNTRKWIEDRNPILISLLETAMEGNKTNLFLTARAVEQIYKLYVPNLISPFSFLQNLTIYTVTGSRLAVDVMGHGGPAGCYQMVQQWLKEHGPGIQMVPDGLVVNVFDNEQVIGRKNRIAPNQSTPISVITNKGYVLLDATSTVQNEEHFKPPTSKRLYESAAASHPSCKEYELLHEQQLHMFIDKAIKVVTQESTGSGGGDFIDVALGRLSGTDIVCETCGVSNSSKKQKCVGCNDREGLRRGKETSRNAMAPSNHQDTGPVATEFSIKFSDSTVLPTEERYSHVPSGHDGKHEIVLTDPLYVNPNSAETVKEVLRQIGRENNLMRYGGTTRHWTVVCCDGLPYSIIKKLKEEVRICQACDETFSNEKLFESHKTHCVDAVSELEFDWVYLKIGSGHFEINLIKAFFELNWTPFLENYCHVMGFQTDAAKRSAKNASDHHKSWALLLAFHLGTLRELVRPYVKSQPAPHSAEGFLIYARSTYTSPNARYLLDQVFRYSQGIINFRMAVRRNHSPLLHSAKYMTKELFNGRNHPKYRDIQVYDECQYMVMPPEVQHVFDRYASITTSGHPSLGECFDFVLEEKNRRVKEVIPKGIPSDEIWLSACRNESVLTEIRQKTLLELGISKPGTRLRPINLEDAIASWRLRLRQTRYIEGTDVHASITGCALDPCLVDFTKEANLRRQYFIKVKVLGQYEDILPQLRQAVFITAEERSLNSGPESLTIRDLQRDITRWLPLLSQEDREAFTIKFNVRGQKKESYVSLYNEIKVLLKD